MTGEEVERGTFEKEMGVHPMAASLRYPSTILMERMPSVGGMKRELPFAAVQITCRVKSYTRLLASFPR